MYSPGIYKTVTFPFKVVMTHHWWVITWSKKCNSSHRRTQKEADRYILKWPDGLHVEVAPVQRFPPLSSLLALRCTLLSCQLTRIHTDTLELYAHKFRTLQICTLTFWKHAGMHQTYPAGWTRWKANLWWCHHAPSGPSSSRPPRCIPPALSEFEERWALMSPVWSHAWKHRTFKDQNKLLFFCIP